MIDFKKIKTIPISQRKNKVSLKDLAIPENTKILIGSNELKELADAVSRASKKGNKVILMIGAHVIKTGMSLVLIDLMKKGIVSHIAMNGAGPIHHFYLSFIF